MTLDEALNELGIDREADAEGARRAYLRLLKKRKPEVDREGFMRLREAYEAAKPYFEQIEMFRAIEKAASAAPAGEDGAPAFIQVETPAGVVWLQTNRAPETHPHEPSIQEKTTVAEDKPGVGEDKPLVEERVVEASEPPVAKASPAEEAPAATNVEPPPSVPEQPANEPVAQAPSNASSEPSIDDLIAAGKLKKAARRMAREYREATQGTLSNDAVLAPHQAVLLLLRLHEKNFVEEARALEKEFAEWLASTGSAPRIMAGPVGVLWLIARELSAISKNFPSELRTGIAKACIAGKLEDAERRADFFQSSDPRRARDAALMLHAHAPTLAKMLGDTLSPPEPRSAPVRPVNPGGWGIGIVLVMVLNVLRLCASSPSSSPTSYRGQADHGSNYRPLPPPSPDSYAKSESSSTSTQDAGSAVDDDVKMDKATMDKLVKLAQITETAAARATKIEERWVIQRTRHVRAALETGSCDRATAEINGFVTDMLVLSDPLNAALLPNAKKLDTMFRAACQKKPTVKPIPDGGPKKP